MIGVNSLDSSAWNSSVNVINAKSKEAYSQSDKNLKLVENGIEKVERAMNDMYEAFNETNIYVNMLSDLIYLYRYSKNYSRTGNRDTAPSGAQNYVNSIIPDRGRKISYELN